MPDECKEQLILLKARVDSVEKTLDRMDADTSKCQTLQVKNWDKQNEKLEKLSEKIELMKNNELLHVNDRLDVLEKGDKTTTIITPQQWIQIILAITGVVGTAMVAFIQVLGGKIG